MLYERLRLRPRERPLRCGLGERVTERESARRRGAGERERDEVRRRGGGEGERESRIGDGLREGILYLFISQCSILSRFSRSGNCCRDVRWRLVLRIEEVRDWNRDGFCLRRGWAWRGLVAGETRRELPSTCVFLAAEIM